jgi:teichuronic acid biosynthesis glycosyltransferase TuaC
MNILFLSLTFPDQISPARGAYNLAFCSALARQHRVHVIAPRNWHEWLKVRREGLRFAPSAETLSAGLTVDFPNFWYVPKVLPISRGNALWQSIRATVSDVGHRFRPDVVISYWAFPDADGGLHVARYFDVPSVVIVGGSDVRILPRNPQYRQAVSRVLKQSTMVTTVSEGLRQDSIALGVSPDRVRTIRQGINADLFFAGDKASARHELNLPLDAETLVWVGRMVPVKNLDLLVAAVAQLAASRPKLRLHLIGDGESQENLQAYVDAAGLSQVIYFEGPVRHALLPVWYRAADATVLSSHSEGLPNVLRESLACGTPFVSTAVGDVCEIARPEFSRLVPAGDLGAFSCAIEAVLDKCFSQAASKYIARSWSACADEYSELIDEISRKKSAPQEVGKRRVVC